MIDSHHHLWRYSAAEYPWIPAASPLAADHLIAALQASTTAAGITGTVAVQARQCTGESDFLLDLADQSNLILGVVGWAPLTETGVGATLERLAAHHRFLGVRHVLQDEPDEYFSRDEFHRGLSLLPGHHLRYDLLIYQHQLPAAIHLVDRQPALEIIVDHLAKPKIQPFNVDPQWRKDMRELAKRPNIAGVKFSGLATEFPASEPVDQETVCAYFDATLEIFGSSRVMFGSDWPVCLLRLDSCAQWAESVRQLVSGLSASEQDAILSSNARRIYGLTDHC
jgi:L-fuconolactonase